MYTLMTKLRAEGKRLVILENGWAGGWSFVCVVNPKIRVPEGERGLEFMRNFIRRTGRARRGRLIKSLPPPQRDQRADF